MILRGFHALLILFSAVLSAFFGVWSLVQYSREGGGAGRVLAAVAAFALAVGLVIYDRWFLRKTRTLR